MKTKIIALYLPQFHCIPENDKFWGKGFTDWVTVKKATPLYEGHNQPRIPMDNNYYDLSQEKNVEWQARLAHTHGIYGFGVYHYWFNNEQNLLTRPAEILRDSNNCSTKYFLIWDNTNWKRSWGNVAGNDWAPVADKLVDRKKSPTILVPYILGSERDWENHYDYVRTHFLSSNYEKRLNKPVFGIHVYGKSVLKMCEYWNVLAKKDGFDGICFIFHYQPFQGLPKAAMRYTYEPHWIGWEKKTFLKKVVNKLKREMHIETHKDIMFYDYDDIWRNLLAYASKQDKPNLIHGAFVGYDDSPRRGRNGAKIVTGGSPEKFKKYLSELYDISGRQNKDYIFLTAWNEWGEGAYLEPDTIYDMSYLQAIKEIVGYQV